MNQNSKVGELFSFAGFKEIEDPKGEYYERSILDTTIQGTKLFFDKEYLKYVSSNNFGVSLFEDSIYIYGLCKNLHWISLFSVNKYLASKFSFLEKHFTSFAEDVFGNQFVFTKDGIMMLEIETGELKFLAKSFEDWADLILSDWKYFSGYKLLKEWEHKNSKALKPNYRLAPKNLFVLGGEYKAENLYQIDTFKLFDFMSSIAVQIYSLPDGQKIKLNISSPENI